MHPLLAISWEGMLVVLVLALLSSISQWLTKKRHREDADADSDETSFPRHVPREPSRPPSPPLAPRPVGWEEELRRLLEGAPAPAPPPARLPPPILPRLPAPSVLQSAPPPTRPVVEAGFTKGDCVHCAGHLEFPRSAIGASITCPHCGHLTRLAPSGQRSPPRPIAPFELPALTEATRTQSRASELAETVAADFRRTDAQTSEPIVPLPTRAPARESRATAETIAGLFQPNSSRQLMIASFVLGPPKALERG